MKPALLVIDMQNDYLWDKRKKRFCYDTDKLTNCVNQIIHRYRDNGCEVIYIRHLIQNLITNRLLFGYSIAGTEGAALYSGLDVVSDICFDKYFGNALTNAKLVDYLSEHRIEEIHLCGLDECGCIAATALGAAKKRLRCAILSQGTGCVFSEQKRRKTHEKLRSAKIPLLSLDPFSESA